MSQIYGYVRILNAKQSQTRQKKNIEEAYPGARIFEEDLASGQNEEQPKLQEILHLVKPQDTIVFDSVSRMCRDADQCFHLYENLFNKNISLVFLKQPYLNTETFLSALNAHMLSAGDKTGRTAGQIGYYLTELVKIQVRIALEQEEKETEELHKRTREGIEQARQAGKQIGQKQGAHLVTKKSIQAKELIRRENRDFGGSLNDLETIELARISRKTFYKYKKEIASEQ